MLKRTLCLLLCLLVLVPPVLAERDRDAVRAAYRALGRVGEASPYEEAPAVSAPYESGALTEAAKADALAYLNFIRWLAGLSPVAESAIYDGQCQRGAVLLAALGYVDHNAPRPADMDENFYASAHLGTASSNIARLGWSRPSILRDGVEYFLRDDGEENLPRLGHRRWALNPMMAATGFGLAEGGGASYVFMFAHDLGSRDARWDRVCWPAPGAFPASLMHADLAWSIALNPEAYDVPASHPAVTLSEAGGLSFRFLPATGGGDGYCTVSYDGYGPGPCLIFRPDFSGTDFTDYQQNQRWTVKVEGLVDANGEEQVMEYAVDMISLNVEDAVAVELSQLEASLRPGEALSLTASVLPSYADDLSVAWESTDEGVASVDQSGLVTARAAGECEIIARTGNGKEEACRVVVNE